MATLMSTLIRILTSNLISVLISRLLSIRISMRSAADAMRKRPLLRRTCGAVEAKVGLAGLDRVSIARLWPGESFWPEGLVGRSGACWSAGGD